MDRPAIRVALVSDLHLEFASSLPCDLSGLAESADLLLAAGDIGDVAGALAWCAGSPVPVCFVPGNHEFYSREIGSARAELAQRASQFANLHLLDPGVATFEFHGVQLRVIGATLWTDLRLFGADIQKAAQSGLRGLNDSRKIRLGERPWTPLDAAAEFEIQRGFIARTLAEPFEGLSVVMTHHAPSEKAIAPRLIGDVLSPCFASDLDYLVADADVWVYGHTHASIETVIGKCRLISNQRGYRNENFGWKVRVYEV